MCFGGGHIIYFISLSLSQRRVASKAATRRSLQCTAVAEVAAPPQVNIAKDVSELIGDLETHQVVHKISPTSSWSTFHSQLHSPVRGSAKVQCSMLLLKTRNDGMCEHCKCRQHTHGVPEQGHGGSECQDCSQAGDHGAMLLSEGQVNRTTLLCRFIYC